jgi:hypothetical protein
MRCKDKGLFYTTQKIGLLKEGDIQAGESLFAIDIYE